MSIASLNDFIDPDLTAKDVLHSNGYAAAAGGGGAGGMSMEQRRKLMNQPRTVGSYHYSKIGRQNSAVKARTADQKQSRVYDASSDTFSDRAGFSNRRGGEVKDRSQVDTASIQRREHFIEPQPRNHDPYA